MNPQIPHRPTNLTRDKRQKHSASTTQSKKNFTIPVDSGYACQRVSFSFNGTPSFYGPKKECCAVDWLSHLSLPYPLFTAPLGPSVNTNFKLSNQPQGKKKLGGFPGCDLAVIIGNGKSYLIHSTIEKDGENFLCLTHLDGVNEYQNFGNAKIKLPLSKDSRIYQICSPPNSGDSLDNGSFTFATRHLKSAEIWKITHKKHLSVKSVFKTKCASVIQDLDFISFLSTPAISELRHNQITVTDTKGNVIFHQELDRDKKYKRCLFGQHPTQLILASKREVEVLDELVRSCRPVLSFKCESMFSLWNLSETECISSIAKSTISDKIYYVTTDSYVLVWDIRMSNKPLMKTVHLMNDPPKFITSLQTDRDCEWIFLDSASSSRMLSFRLDRTDIAIDCISTRVESLRRKSLTDTLSALHLRGVTVDPMAQAQLTQETTGTACDLITKDDRKIVRIWNRNFLGDVFVQQLNIDDQDSDGQDVAILQAGNWLKSWNEEFSSPVFIPKASFSYNASQLVPGSLSASDVASPPTMLSIPDLDGSLQFLKEYKDDLNLIKFWPLGANIATEMEKEKEAEEEEEMTNSQPVSSTPFFSSPGMPLSGRVPSTPMTPLLKAFWARRQAQADGLEIVN